MKIGERIKVARENKGYSQAALAELLGYKSRSSINKIEKEGRDIPRSITIKLAKLLDVTPAYLMGWEEKNLPIDKDYPEVRANENAMSLSDHEKEVMNAYRNADKTVQDGVDRFLGIEPLVTEQQAIPYP